MAIGSWRYARLAGLLCLLSCAPQRVEAPRALPRASTPRLVVQVTVDQLRPDLLTRLWPRLGARGFRRFLEAGVDFRDARYAHAATETAVGHATLSTGALPADHGVVANEWFDPTLSRARFSVEDERSPIVTSAGPLTRGASPYALRVTTLGDELSLATSGRALVYSVSIKDRAAILSCGRAGKAFWLDDGALGMVSSEHYFKELPAWVSTFNNAHGDAYLAGLRWELTEPKERYARGDYDDAPSERLIEGWTRAFPHALGDISPAARFSALRRTPFGDALTLEFVEALLANVPLGRDDTPDLLAISFSTTDYVAHAFGPESLELEDQLLRLDRVMERLFDSLLARVPEAQLMVVLAADHGGEESPEHLLAQGLSAGRHDEKLLLQTLNEALQGRYGEGPSLLRAFVNPYLWLDEQAVEGRGLTLADVERTLAAVVLAQPGFARAYPRSTLASRVSSTDPITERVQRNFDDERSGHVHVVPQAGWLLAGAGEHLASMHGTPHRYDTDVVLSFYGMRIGPRRVFTPADPRDVAPTLAALLGIKAPSGASGRVLDEVMGEVR